MIYIAGITFTLYLISFIANRKKTTSAFKKACKKFANIIMPLSIVLILVSIILFFFPENSIAGFIVNKNKFLGLLSASALGSVVMMPGFIAFPLGGILKEGGVYYMVISGFTSTLMMVGILTYPIEKKYFGAKFAIIRNISAFIISIILSLIIGILFGELF